MFLSEVGLPQESEKNWYHPDLPVAVKIKNTIKLPDMDVLKDRKLVRLLKDDGTVGYVYRDHKGFHAISLVFSDSSET